MADIGANYLENPDNGFWVAEADVRGRSKVVGMVAVTGKGGGEQGERFDERNGGLTGGGEEFAQDAGDGRDVPLGCGVSMAAQKPGSTAHEEGP